MILAIDVGNISTTVALFSEDGTLSFQSALNTDPKMTDDRCAIDLLGVFSLYGAELSAVTGSILSSVVPPITRTYVRTLIRLTGKAPLTVGAGLKTGLNIRADTHTQLGGDIVASAVAAVRLYPGPAIVINCRTAATFSYLRERSLEGCSIMPGAEIALEALSRNGAQLPQVAIGHVDTPLGRNTEDAMRAGVLYGYSGAFDRIIGEMERAAGAPAVAVVATGTDMPELYRLCRREITYDHDLPVKGLFFLYKKNTDRSRKPD